MIGYYFTTDFSLHSTAVDLRASAPAPRVGEERAGCDGFGVHLRGLPFSLADSGLSMKFRDHPELKSKGFQSWPPLWVDVERKAWNVITGEVGVLMDVRMRDADSSRLFLTMQHQGGSFVGVLFLDSEPFCVKVYEFLKTCIGRDIKEIGDMEFQ